MEQGNTKQQFEEVYAKEVDSLFKYCALRVSSKTQAMDIVQDVFIELWQVYQKGEEVKNDRALLFTILRNRIIDWYRKKKALSLDSMMEKRDGEPSFEPRDIKAEESIVFSAESKRAVEAINTLDDTYREVLYLRLIEDLTPEEIGSVLDLNANTVSVRITRGLEKLRTKLNIEKLL